MKHLILLSLPILILSCSKSVVDTPNVPEGYGYTTNPTPVQECTGEITAPIYRVVKPEYPEHLRKNRAAGTVILQLLITKDGTLSEIEVKRSTEPRLNEITIFDAMHQHYNPGYCDGIPVDMLADFKVEYKLVTRTETYFN